MAGVITLLDQPRALDALGRATDAIIYFYYTGTTILAPIYNDEAMTDPAANPIDLAAGQLFPDIFLDPAVTYRRRILYGDGTFYDVDPLPIGSGNSAEGILFEQAGTGAVTRTVQNKLRETYSVTDFGATGDGVTDDTTNIQKAINALPNGGTIIFPRGDYFLLTGITVTANDVELLLEEGASLTYTTPTITLITINGSSCRLTGGEINAPAVFDGTNSPVLYSTVWIAGDDCTVTDVTFNNVPRVGINFKDCNRGRVSGCLINGGTSDTFFTGINTVHGGINLDPPGTGSQGGLVVTSTRINRCVQGVVSGAIGAASLEQSVVIDGNLFEDCWNHGVYAGGFAHGWAVTSNSFSGCQVPVALTGYEHVVVGNSMTVQTTGTGVITDNEMTGISLRDPVRCVVSGNVIKGENPNGGVVIGLDDLNAVSGANRCEGNVVSNNTILITNTTVAGVIAIRLLSESGNVANNVVEGNNISAPLRSGEGLISIQGAGSACVNNTVKNNLVSMTGIRGGGYGFALINLHTTDCSGNLFSIQCDAGSAMTLTIFALASNVFTTCNNNVVSCTSAWGTNITVRVFQELTSASNNFAGGTRVSLDPTKLAGQSLFLSAMLIDHMGTGTPEGNVLALVGSIWRRTDGGAATTLYVKESGTSNTGWIGK